MSPTDGSRPEPISSTPHDLHCLPGLVVGPVALRHLRRGARDGEILAAFRRSAYVQLGPGEVICLCSAHLSAGPLNVVIQAPETIFAGLQPGSPVRASTASLHLDERHAVDFASAAEWHPPQTPLRHGWGEIKCGLAMVAQQLEYWALAEGFAPLLRPLCADWTRLEVTSHGELDLLKAAVPVLRDLLAWLAGSASNSSPAPVARIIGLGPGLTPSGDDLLCGMLIALHATGHKRLADRLAEAVSREAASGTGIISAAHLSCASEGMGSDALHAALCALLECNDTALERALLSLSKTGHSSGWDGLAGVVACLAVLEANRAP